MIPAAVLAAALCAKLYGTLEGEKKKTCEKWALEIVNTCKASGDYYVPKVLRATPEYVDILCVEERPREVKA